MNSSSFLKLLATFVAVFGLAAVPALAQDPEPQPTPPEEQPAPEQPGAPDDGTGGAATEDGGDEEEEPAPLSGKEPTPAEVDQFNRVCTSKTSEPSHNDKKFCDDFKAKFGEPGASASGTGKQPTQEEIDRYNRYCKMTSGEPSHNDKKFCEDFKKKYPNYGKGTTAGTNTTPTDTGEEAKKDDEPDSGPLAFTGLDLWQLLLIGIVLVAGGLGARYMLRQREAGA